MTLSKYQEEEMHIATLQIKTFSKLDSEYIWNKIELVFGYNLQIFFTLITRM